MSYTTSQVIYQMSYTTGQVIYQMSYTTGDWNSVTVTKDW
jgi:hypothetical protein